MATEKFSDFADYTTQTLDSGTWIVGYDANADANIRIPTTPLPPGTRLQLDTANDKAIVNSSGALIVGNDGSGIPTLRDGTSGAGLQFDGSGRATIVGSNAAAQISIDGSGNLDIRDASNAKVYATDGSGNAVINNGWSGTFPTDDGRTVTVLNGIITNVA